MSLRYFAFRLLHSVLVILGVLVLVFFVTHLLGDPVRIVLPPTASEAQIAALRERLGLDQPLAVQFGQFAANAASGSFGDSFWQLRPAMPLVLGRLPATLYLAFVAFLFVLPIGIGLGVLASLRPGSLLERGINVISFVGISIVDFWLALMLILVFAVHLRLFPTSGFGGLDHVFLPAVTLALLGAGSLAQVTKASVTDELSKAYVASARARGISENRIIVRHALRNALIPIVTVSGATLTGLLGGAIIAETVFGWPGVGMLMIQAIDHRDLPLIEACVFVTAIIVTFMNLGIDLLYGKVNPRVRLT